MPCNRASIPAPNSSIPLDKLRDFMELLVDEKTIPLKNIQCFIFINIKTMAV
jgi:hypothetical protein